VPHAKYVICIWETSFDGWSYAGRPISCVKP
jgi:hypothetical protein